MPDILVVTDDSDSVEPVLRILKMQGAYHVEKVDAGLAVEFLGSGNFDVAIIDCTFDEKEGRNTLDYLAKHFPDIGYIMFVKHVSVEKSDFAAFDGSYDYITQATRPEDLLKAVDKKAEKSSPRKDENAGETEEKSKGFGMLIGESKEIKSVFDIIVKVADTDSTVLITGESGTGKELIARAIHANSSRRKNPMVVINCGAIQGELLESELFGHEKGAFTGAHRTRIGRFEMANESTVFLDEIGDMSPSLQVKLLRVLQEQSFERVGSTQTIKVDIRVLAATNKDLVKSIKENKFREDLYYRLNVIPIKVAALRNRRHDIPLLVNYFQRKLFEQRGHSQKVFLDSTMDAMMRYHWPGNIRELENLMERLYVLVDHETIEDSDLPDNIKETVNITDNEPESNPYISSLFTNGMGFNEAIEKYQKDLILQALNRTNWVKAKAAELLKMNRTTLVEKIKKMNIEASRNT